MKQKKNIIILVRKCCKNLIFFFFGVNLTVLFHCSGCSSSTFSLTKIMACSNVDKTLRKFFYWLGFNIGQTPWYFIIVPILLTLVMITGFQQMDYNYDPEYLFSPNGGHAKQERAMVEHFFPTNYSDFKASRITRPGKFGRVIIAAKDGGTMLRTPLWNQLLFLDQVIIRDFQLERFIHPLWKLGFPCSKYDQSLEKKTGAMMGKEGCIMHKGCHHNRFENHEFVVFQVAKFIRVSSFFQKKIERV